MSNVAIRVEGLSKQYRIGKPESYKTLRETLVAAASSPWRRMRSAFRGAQSPAGDDRIWALKQVSFDVKPGDVIGIVGRNGAGKSTLLKILSRITEPTEGYAEINGRVCSLLEVGTGFHPELTGRENIYLNGAILGMRKAEIERKFDEIVDFAEVRRFIETPVKHFSSGMYLRLAFAVAAHLEPEILVVDEVLAVGDAAFQRKCVGKMESVSKRGRTVLFVSHNMGAVRSLCNKGVFLANGQVAQLGRIEKTIEAYYRSFQEVTTEAPGPVSGLRFGQIRLNGGAEGTIQQSEGFEISTELFISRNVDGFSLNCFLEDMNGRQIFHVRDESPNLGFKSGAAGKYTLAVGFPPLWLSPGLYSVYFKLFLWGDGRETGGRRLSDKLPLDVAGDSSITDSVLHPRAAWSISNS